MQYYTQNPDQALSADKPATAFLEEGLRCRVEWDGGVTISSDMPKGLGGGASAPTPGWLCRAAFAACDVTMIALRAVKIGADHTSPELMREIVGWAVAHSPVGDTVSRAVPFTTKIDIII